MMDDVSMIEWVGNITPKDVEDGTVLIFRISERSYPQEVLKQITDSIKRAVEDTFDGKVKAMILPDTIEVTMLRDLLKEKIDE